MLRVERRSVSIPYERESTCERRIANSAAEDLSVFQFPTNGKVHVNSENVVLLLLRN